MMSPATKHPSSHATLPFHEVSLRRGRGSSCSSPTCVGHDRGDSHFVPPLLDVLALGETRRPTRRSDHKRPRAIEPLSYPPRPSLGEGSVLLPSAMPAALSAPVCKWRGGTRPAAARLDLWPGHAQAPGETPAPASVSSWASGREAPGHPTSIRWNRAPRVCRTD